MVGFSGMNSKAEGWVGGLGIVVLQVAKIQDTCHGAALEFPDPATEISPAPPAHRACMTILLCIGREPARSRGRCGWPFGIRFSGGRSCGRSAGATSMPWARPPALHAART